MGSALPTLLHDAISPEDGRCVCTGRHPMENGSEQQCCALTGSGRLFRAARGMSGTCQEEEKMSKRTMKKYAPVFLLPTMIAFTIGFIAPFVLGVYLSFCEFTTVTRNLWA